MPALRLHTFPLSHWCVSAERMLDFKGLEYERVPVRYGDHAPLLERTGQDYIPYLEVGRGKKGVRWFEIPDWLEKERPDPTLYPHGTRGVARLIEDWAHQVVEEAVWRYVVPDAVGTFKDPAERWIFVELQERRRGPLEVMALRRKEFLEDVRRVCGLAEGMLDGFDFLLGDDPSLADFALYGSLWPLRGTGNAIPAEFKGLRAWERRVARL